MASCSTPEFKFVDTSPSNQPPHCENQQQDEGESDLDCGGACPPCALTQTCNSTADCREGECADGTCQAEGCNDQSQNGSETDEDCGGGCKPCPVGAGCSVGMDCQTGVCGEQGCAEATCGDRVRNGEESDIDCGGGDCTRCTAGRDCLTPTDCVENDCNAGKCAPSCTAGLGNCDGDPTTGCETNLRTDRDHCGDCATACSLTNANAGCAGGVCRVESCRAPFEDCNGDPVDGCETNTKIDLDNCGGCGAKTCPTLNGQAFCADSQCGLTCAKNFADCDDLPANGCEKDVSRDVNNCGGCGAICTASAGKTAWCRQGQCGETTCAAGRGDCNGDPDDDAANNGCETDLKTAVDSCGTCGAVCGISGGEAQCLAGTCSIKTCSPGLADCGGGYADGCETNTTTSQTHCGACTGASANCTTLFPNANAQCVNSACTLKTCATDYADCDNTPSNGCESNLKTDEQNCGSCKLVCSGVGAQGPNCEAGVCKPKCNAPMLTCSNPPQNGCTINSATDIKNCGGCNVVCGSTNTTGELSCTNGKCTPECLPNLGLGACGPPEAGCTTPLGTVTHCSKCDEACTGATPLCLKGVGCKAHFDIGVVGTAISAKAGFEASIIPSLSKDHVLVNSKASGRSRIVLVGVTANDLYLSSTKYVTYGTTVMRLAIEARAEGQSYAGIYYLLDDELPVAAGTYPVKVQFSTTAQNGVGAFTASEFQNVQQGTSSFVTSLAVPTTTDCSAQTSRGVPLTFSQAGSFGYAVIAARAGTTAMPTPGALVETMNLLQSQPTPLMGLAGYAGPINGNTTLSWNVTNCSSTAGAGVVLKRVGD